MYTRCGLNTGGREALNGIEFCVPISIRDVETFLILESFERGINKGNHAKSHSSPGQGPVASSLQAITMNFFTSSREGGPPNVTPDLLKYRPLGLYAQSNRNRIVSRRLMVVNGRRSFYWIRIRLRVESRI